MKIKEIMNDKKCSGCMACANICPKAAIKIKKIEGFEYPYIDEDICVKCGKCNISCPIINDSEEKKYSQKVYAAKNKNTQIRMNSSSGGVFTIIAEWILDNDGVVFGAKFNEKMQVVHAYTETKEGLAVFRGSKYVQSKIGTSYKKVKEFLENGKKVLFTGTPCQVEGLLSFLGKKYDNLYTQDIICHGIPSPFVWEKYLEYIEKIHGDSITNINFREKKQKGWTNYQVRYNYENYEEIINHKDDLYMQIFLRNIALRESCYNCKFKKILRNSDFTIADFWGINTINPEFNDEKGVSALIINSNKGLEIFDNIKNKLEYTSQKIENIVKYNLCIKNSSARDKDRDIFIKELEENGFDFVIKKYLKHD